MARRAKAKGPGDALDDVFDTAAPPPPQAFVKGGAQGRSDEAVGARPDRKASVPSEAAAPAPFTPGPWYTCGLGGGLLAKNAVLFWVLTGLTYVVGLGMLYYLLLVLYLWWVLGSCGAACSEACDGCSCGSGDSSDGGCDGCCRGGSDGATAGEEERETPAYGVVTGMAGILAALGLRRLDRGRLAHHPDLPEFAQDVWRVRGARICVGCSVVYPIFLVVAGVLAARPAPDAWGTWLVAGLALTSVQAVSALGWTRWRWLKVLVKAALGSGLAVATHAILAAPWPHLVQGAALTALVAAAGLSALPRRRRIQVALAARA